MKHGRWSAAFVSIIGVLGVLLALAVPRDSHAQSAIWTKKQLLWTGVAGASAPTNTKSFTSGGVDTFRTTDINTADWDWATLAQVQGSSSGPITIPVYFEATAPVAALDTVYFNVEKRIFSAGTYSGNRSLAAAAGNCAVLCNGTINDAVMEGQLKVDIDTPGKDNIWLCPIFRLRVASKTQGSAVLAGVRCWIVYPKRAGT